jgi:hypothetical protein
MILVQSTNLNTVPWLMTIFIGYQRTVTFPKIYVNVQLDTIVQTHPARFENKVLY